MRAEIHNTETGYAYTVEHADQCRDETDYSAYVTACSLGDVVTMGCVVVQPKPLPPADLDVLKDAAEMVGWGPHRDAILAAVDEIRRSRQDHRRNQ